MNQLCQFENHLTSGIAVFHQPLLHRGGHQSLPAANEMALNF